MKVYVLIAGDQSDSEVVGVFTSEEKLEAAKKDLIDRLGIPWYRFSRTQEFDLDEVDRDANSLP